MIWFSFSKKLLRKRVVLLLLFFVICCYKLISVDKDGPSLRQLNQNPGKRVASDHLIINRKFVSIPFLKVNDKLLLVKKATVKK